MIHGVYICYNPEKKGLWQLVSASISGETAVHDRDITIAKAREAGNQQAIARIKTVDTIIQLSETLKELKEDSKQLYN